MRVTIKKEKLNNQTTKKYGWKPTYYEVRVNGKMVAYAETKKKAEIWAKRFKK